MSIGTRTQQRADKDRPFWVYVWQGSLEGGGVFGASGGWVRYNAGVPGRRVNLARTRYSWRCVRNCSPGGSEPPVYEYDPQSIDNPIPNNDGRPPAVTAFVPAGLPGQTGAIPSFFPPIKVEIDCQQSPLRIEGGQLPTLYDVTLSATGVVRDFGTDNIIVPFSVETTLRGPGPIIGYTVSQYTFGSNQKDLRANVYYQEGENGIGDFRKDFRLSLSSILGAGNNMTIEGDQYYFDVDQVILENLVRTDGIDDQCGSSACKVDFEVNYYLDNDPGTILTYVQNATVQFPVARIGITGNPGEDGRSVIAYSEGDAQSTTIFTAFTNNGLLPGEVIVSAPLLNINCTYSVNGQLPGCFIESPETCNVRISDRSGILLDQTYFGRPEIETSSELILP